MTYFTNNLKSHPPEFVQVSRTCKMLRKTSRFHNLTPRRFRPRRISAAHHSTPCGTCRHPRHPRRNNHATARAAKNGCLETRAMIGNSASLDLLDGDSIQIPLSIDIARSPSHDVSRRESSQCPTADLVPFYARHTVGIRSEKAIAEFLITTNNQRNGYADLLGQCAQSHYRSIRQQD